jgi:hypothetical protein
LALADRFADAFFFSVETISTNRLWADVAGDALRQYRFPERNRGFADSLSVY